MKRRSNIRRQENNPAMRSGIGALVKPAWANISAKKVEELQNQSHERIKKVCWSYLAFLVAVLLAVLTRDLTIENTDTIVTLLAISIPALALLPMADYNIRILQGRPLSAIRGWVAGLAFIPSLIALYLLIGSVSTNGAKLFVASVILVVALMIILGVRAQLDYWRYLEKRRRTTKSKRTTKPNR
mgnify:CR=1 FL=1